MARKSCQHSIHHATGHGLTDTKEIIPDAIEYITGSDEVDLISTPMITGVNEILGVINNLHHRIAVYSQLNAVFGGLGIR